MRPGHGRRLDDDLPPRIVNDQSHVIHQVNAQRRLSAGLLKRRRMAHVNRHIAQHQFAQAQTPHDAGPRRKFEKPTISTESGQTSTPAAAAASGVSSVCWAPVSTNTRDSRRPLTSVEIASRSTACGLAWPGRLAFGWPDSHHRQHGSPRRPPARDKDAAPASDSRENLRAATGDDPRIASGLFEPDESSAARRVRGLVASAPSATA